MADNLKKIGAKITLDGEKEYRQALKNITSEQKVLKSEMKLAQAQYKATGGSIESMQQKSKVLTDQIETQSKQVDILKEALEKAKEQYGENSTQANNWQTQLNNAEADLVSLNSALADNEAALKEAQAGATDTGNAIDTLDKELSDTENTSKGWGARLLENLSFTDILNLGKTAFGVIQGAAQAVYQTVQQSAAYADDVLTEAAQNGLDTADVQTFKYMSELIDTPTETIESAMTKITKAMDSARDGSTKYKDAFSKIGVQYKNDDGTLKDANEVFWDTVDALGKMQPGAERDSIAMDLFGRSAKDLTGIIDTGRAGFEKYKEEAEKVGVVLSGDQLTALGNTNDAIYKLDQAVQGFKLQASTVLAPAITDILGLMTSVVVGATNIITGNKTEFDKSIDDIVSKIDGTIEKFSTINEDYDKATNQIDADVALSKSLADTIFNLAGNTELTKDEELKLYGSLMAINKLIPGLNLQYDKQTGQLSKTRAEVDELTDAYKAQALEAAISAKGSSLVATYAELYMEKVEAERKISEAVAEYGTGTYQAFVDRANSFLANGFSYAESYQKAYDSLYKDLEIINADGSTFISDIDNKLPEYANLRDLYIALNDADTKLQEADTDVQEFNATAQQAREEMGLAVDDISLVTETTEEGSEAVSGLTEELDEEAESLTTLQKELKAYADSAGVSFDEVQAHFTELADAYAEAYKSAESSIEGQTGLFNKLTGESEVTAEQMLDNLLGQNRILESWSEDIQKLMEAGLAEGLVQQLIDAGPSAAQAVHDMARQVTDENNTFIENLNAAYEEQLDIKSGFAGAMAEAQTGFNEYAQELGLSSEVVEEELANRGVSAGTAFGDNLIDGLAQSAALDDNAEEILAKAEENAEAYKQSGESAANNYTTGMQTALATSKEQLTTDLSEIEKMFETSKDTIAGYGDDSGLNFLANITTQLSNSDNTEPVQTEITAIEGFFEGAADAIGTSGDNAGNKYIDDMTKALGNSDKLYGDSNSVDSKLKGILNIADGKIVSMGTIGTNMGDALINSFINKINARLGEVTSAVGRIDSSVKFRMGIHSPSKVMMESGAYIGEGLIDGTVAALHDGLPDLTEEMERMSSQLTYGFGNLSMAPTSTAPAVTYTAELAALRGDISALSRAILERPIVLDSGELVGGISGKMDMTFAQSQLYHQRRN